MSGTAGAVDYVTAWVHRCRRDVVVASGAEVVDYLHGQITQDVESMSVGASRLSMVLEPKGLLDALFRITRIGDDTFWLDVPVGVGEALVGSLERFKLRTDVDFTLHTGSMSALRIMFANASDASQPNTAAMTIDANAPGALAGAQCFWYGAVPSADAPANNAVDVLELTDRAEATISVVIAEGPDEGAQVPVRDLDAESYSYLRCFVGLPEMGTELSAGAVPNETGLLDLAVSFTKGCYRGQELVERIDSRAGGRRTVMRFYANAEVAAGDHIFGAEAMSLLNEGSDAPRRAAKRSSAGTVGGPSGGSGAIATVLSAAAFSRVHPDLRDQVANHGVASADPLAPGSNADASLAAGAFTDDVSAPLTVGFVRTERTARSADAPDAPSGGFVLAPVAFTSLVDPEV